jgi:hydroxyacylglutathione hydrolase
MNQAIRTIPLKVPCFLVNAGDGFVVIDTGDSSDRAHLEKELDHAGVKPGNLKLIILTHGDFDHAGNAAFLRAKYGGQIAMHRDDSGMVERGDQSWNRKARSDRVTIFGRIIMVISSLLGGSGKFDTFKPDVYIDDGFDLSGYGFEARVLHLPGHSKGSIGILTAGDDLFCGDLLMNMFKPDLHFLIDDLADCHNSLAKLKRVKIGTVYPGHGKPFPMDRWITKLPQD